MIDSSIKEFKPNGILNCCKETALFLINFESGSIWNVCAICSQLDVFSRYIRSREVLQ